MGYSLGLSWFDTDPQSERLKSGALEAQRKNTQKYDEYDEIYSIKPSLRS